jgi:hypothetical protein
MHRLSHLERTPWVAVVVILSAAQQAFPPAPQTDDLQEQLAQLGWLMDVAG